MSSGWHRRRDTPAAQARARQYATPQHRALRASIQRKIDSGQPISCWRCGHPIVKGTRWHLGHDDHDRSIYRGAECASCNVKAAARKGARIVNAKQRRRRAQSRAW